MMTLSDRKKGIAWSSTATAMEPNIRTPQWSVNKVMAADKKRFTQAMRNATNSKSPPGGSLRKHGAQPVN
jgi:hypothetical protein